MNYYFNKDLFMNCTKMPGKFWRIYMSEPTGEYVFAADQQKAYQDVADQLGIGFKVGKPHWQTAWDVRNNIAEKYRNGRMLICGDASHVSLCYIFGIMVAEHFAGALSIWRPGHERLYAGCV
jgi:regulation of enolase protein 1 (concanavalin A-like superfamily)